MKISEINHRNVVCCMSKKFFVSVVIFIFLFGCSDSKKWTLFYYPNINNIPDASQVENYIAGNFLSFEDCQNAAVDMIRKHHGNGDYQCGLNCKTNKDYDLLVCETIKK